MSPAIRAQSAQFLPEAPQASSLPSGAQLGEAARAQAADSIVAGRVLDATGAAVVGAHVSLNLIQHPGVVTAVIGSDGSFSIAVPNPGPFHLEVTAHGFAAYQTSGETKQGEKITLPDITLAIAAVSTEVEVEADSTQIAIQQVHAEEKQRILGVVPNYYVSYNQDTAPLPAKQKFDLAWRFTLDPASLAIVGIIAGVRQANNTFSGYGQGAQGYGKRYAAAYGDFLTGIFISNAILPSVLKQDPRYFYKGAGSKRSRILYAIANAVICKGDNGRWQTNYSSILGSLASGGISNAYYPAKNRRGAALTFENAATNIGATAAANLAQEFLFKKLDFHGYHKIPTVLSSFRE
jgi:hypothetical protein